MTQKYQVKVSMKQAAIVETGIVLKQGDFGMQIEIEVLDFDVTGTTPQIVFRKAMGAVESTTITVSSNKYTYTFKGTELDTPGKCFCDLKLKNSTTQRISTASFMFKVVADTLDGLAEESSSYSDTIAQIVAGFDEEIDDYKNMVVTYTNQRIKPGKNLLNVNALTEGYWWRPDRRQKDANANLGYSENIYSFNGETYVVSHSCFIAWFNAEGTMFYGEEKAAGGTFTLADHDSASNKAAYFNVSIWLTNKNTFQLEVGETQTTYESYRTYIEGNTDTTLSISGLAADSQEVGTRLTDINNNITSINNNLTDTNNKIIIERNKVVNHFSESIKHGKNLLNVNALTEGYWWRPDRRQKDANANLGYSENIYSFNGETYVVSHSCFIAWFNSEGTMFYGEEKAAGGTFTLADHDSASNKAAYFNVSIWLTNKNTFQLEVGETATTYEKFYTLIPGLGLQPNSIITKVGKDPTMFRYTTIKDAINATADGGTVLIYPGTYTESISNNQGVNLRDGKNISLIGIDREKCILRSNLVDRQTPPLEFSAGHIANLTIIADRDPDTDVPSITSLPYGIHMDYNGEDDKRVVIENCNIESKWNSAIGVGMRGGFELIIRNCDLYTHVVNSYPVNMGALYFHDTPNGGTVGTSEITIENCYIHTNYKYILSIDNVGLEGDRVNAHFVNNRFWSKDNGVTRAAVRPDQNYEYSGFLGAKNIFIAPDSFGNNLDLVNYSA